MNWHLPDSIVELQLITVNIAVQITFTDYKILKKRHFIY